MNKVCPAAVTKMKEYYKILMANKSKMDDDANA
jgi:hypothetical protein